MLKINFLDILAIIGGILELQERLNFRIGESWISGATPRRAKRGAAMDWLKCLTKYRDFENVVKKISRF